MSSNIVPEDEIFKYYHIHERKLGEGGFAKVRLATHIASQQFVAVKILDKVKLGPELPRIYNEIKCLKKLRHKNIARLYQVFETTTVIYLILEYCSGGELFDYIVKRGKLEESEAAQYVYDLMKVLDFIHINGFAHRDLKPENVLFDDKKQIKLIDFGLAANCSPDNMATNKNQAPMGQLSTCCGSITYAAPEVISGGVYSGTAVDVWSAGIVMYACLVGQLPFNDDSISKLYQKIQGGIRKFPPFLSADACDLLSKMLTVDPRYRITVRDVLLHSWLRNKRLSVSRITRQFDLGSTMDLEEHIKIVPFVSPCKPTSGRRATANCKLTPSKQSPSKKARFLTVTNTPRTPRTPPSYLRRLQESTNTPKTAPSKLTMVTMAKFKPTQKKSLVKRLLDSATPKKLRKRMKLLDADHR